MSEASTIGERAAAEQAVDVLSQVVSIKITFSFKGFRYSIESDTCGRRTLRGGDGKMVSVATQADGWVSASPVTDFADQLLGLIFFRGTARFLPGG
jgi:hypothetical protein